MRLKVAENTSRFATFLASLDQGKSLLVAIDEAKNVTVNFNRRGTATRPLGMFYVFFNASVQGAAQIARVAFKNRKRFAKVVASLAAPGSSTACYSISFWRVPATMAAIWSFRNTRSGTTL